MSFDAERPHSDAAGGPEMDKLIDDIQAYLRAENASEADVLYGEAMPEEAGMFLPPSTSHTTARIGVLARYGSYLVQGVAMLALGAVVSIRWADWLSMGLALLGVLGGGLVGVVLLLGVEARIRLLCDIEQNTRRIAQNKKRIAELLERIWLV